MFGPDARFLVDQPNQVRVLSAADDEGANDSSESFGRFEVWVVSLQNLGRERGECLINLLNRGPALLYSRGGNVWCTTRWAVGCPASVVCLRVAALGEVASRGAL